MRFSVIVPIYGVEEYLHQCVDSALKQTFRDFELILVDDGSKDRCPQIIDDYAGRDPRVVPVHKENGGLVSARKAGARLAKGEYVVILDGDDWLEETALEKLSAAIDRYAPDLVCCDHFASDGRQAQKANVVTGEWLYEAERLEEEILPRLLAGGKEKKITPTLWGKAFRRELYLPLQLALDERVQMGEDGAVVYPYICQCRTVAFIPHGLYYYRDNPQSMTRSKKKQIPWEGALLRIGHFQKHLPLDRYDMRRQLGCYAAHSVFNVILTQMQHRKYAQVRQEARQMLKAHELLPLIRQAKWTGSFSEKLAQFALRTRWLFLIKLYAMLR